MSARTVAFAGPVGVGKTALVAALAGIEDALVGAQEHRTGRTALPHEVLCDGVGLVDLPGSVSGPVLAALAAADAHVLCVAADDGPTPELLEHAHLLAALDRPVAAVCLTRCDRAGAAPGLAAGLPAVDAAVPVLRTDAATGAVDPAPLLDVVRGLDRRPATGPVVLHVESVQEVPGAGTAVVGGVLRGTLAVGAALQLLPAWHDALVGAVRVRGALATQAVAGDRVVVRLDGVPAGEVAPGDALVGPEAGVVRSRVLDVALGEHVRLAHGSDVTALAGAREVRAEVAWLGGRFHQLRLAAQDELLVAPWDRVVLRTGAGEVAGADVLDPAARRQGPSRELLAALARRARGERDG